MRQCLPVIPKGTRSETVAATISRAAFWPFVECLELHEIMRLRDAAGEEGAHFAGWLLHVGQGIINHRTAK